MIKIKVSQIPETTAEIVRIQGAPQARGYALTSDSALGMPPDIHQYFNRRFFSDQVLNGAITSFYPINKPATKSMEVTRQPGDPTTGLTVTR